MLVKPSLSVLVQVVGHRERACWDDTQLESPNRYKTRCRLQLAEGSECSVRPRRESRNEPDAERHPGRTTSAYHITDDLPQSMRDQLREARTAQFVDLAGAMNEHQSQRWTTYKAFMANPAF